MPTYLPALIPSDICVTETSCVCVYIDHGDGGSRVAFPCSGQLLPEEFLHCEIVPRLSKSFHISQINSNRLISSVLELILKGAVVKGCKACFFCEETLLFAFKLGIQTWPLGLKKQNKRNQKNPQESWSFMSLSRCVELTFSDEVRLVFAP